MTAPPVKAGGGAAVEAATMAWAMPGAVAPSMASGMNAAWVKKMSTWAMRPAAPMTMHRVARGASGLRTTYRAMSVVPMTRPVTFAAATAPMMPDAACRAYFFSRIWL